MKTTQTKTINLPIELHKRIKTIAVKEDMRMRTLVIELLETGLAIKSIR